MNDKVKIEFRSELYNIFNHTNLYLPGGSGPSLSAGGSGGGTTSPTSVSASAANTLITGTFEPRIVQFGLKIIY
jgi:hypothetical protein